MDSAVYQIYLPIFCAVIYLTKITLCPRFETCAYPMRTGYKYSSEVAKTLTTKTRIKLNSQPAKNKV